MTAAWGTSSSASAGFTVVEVLMAVLVMTVGLLGLLQSLQVAYHHNARNRLRDEAVQIAEEQMNQFRLLSFDNLTASATGGTLERELLGVHRVFRVVRDCEPVGLTAERCLPHQGTSKKLMVLVAWQFQNATTQHVIYTIKNK